MTLPLSGTKLGPYTTDHQIGRDGMRAVYLGHDGKLDRDVAIKVFAGSMAHEEDLDRLLARVDHDGLRPEDHKWHLDLRRRGSAPHGGFDLVVRDTLGGVPGRCSVSPPASGASVRRFLSRG